MASYEVHIPRDVERQIRIIPLPWRERIKRALNLLAQDPFFGEKMKGKFEGKRKVRVCPYRIFYHVYKRENIILITEVQHRGSTRYK